MVHGDIREEYLQSCGILYFPIFLFRAGLYTLIYSFFYDPSHIVLLPAYDLRFSTYDVWPVVP